MQLEIKIQAVFLKDISWLEAQARLIRVHLSSIYAIIFFKNRFAASNVLVAALAKENGKRKMQ